MYTACDGGDLTDSEHSGDKLAENTMVTVTKGPAVPQPNFYGVHVMTTSNDIILSCE